MCHFLDLGCCRVHLSLCLKLVLVTVKYFFFSKSLIDKIPVLTASNDTTAGCSFIISAMATVCSHSSLSGFTLYRQQIDSVQIHVF